MSFHRHHFKCAFQSDFIDFVCSSYFDDLLRTNLMVEFETTNQKETESERKREKGAKKEANRTNHNDVSILLFIVFVSLSIRLQFFFLSRSLLTFSLYFAFFLWRALRSFVLCFSLVFMCRMRHFVCDERHTDRLFLLFIHAINILAQ